MITMAPISMCPLSFNPGEEAEAAMSKPKESKAPATQAPLQDNQLPQLPDELCGIWAYITWEAAGCPNRSQEESSREFQNAIKVLSKLRALEHLWIMLCLSSWHMHKLVFASTCNQWHSIQLSSTTKMLKEIMA